MYWPQMTEEDCGLCMFSSLQDSSNNLSVVNWRSFRYNWATTLLFIFTRCKQLKQLICFSENDFLILLTLVWCQINRASMTSVNVKKPIVLNTFFMLPRLHSMSKDGMLKDVIYAHNTGGGCNFSTGSSRIMTGTNSGFCKKRVEKRWWK